MLATILLVDDVRLHLELENTFLHRHDVRVLTSGQGPQVLALARQKRPDVVVVDIRSPDETGLHLCREMKVDPAPRKTSGQPPVHLRGERPDRAGVQP